MWESNPLLLPGPLQDQMGGDFERVNSHRVSALNPSYVSISAKQLLVTFDKRKFTSRYVTGKTW